MYNRKRMKTKKILFGLVSGALLLTGCDVNEIPTFNDADAFVAFTTGTGSINENSTDSLVIEVLCTSLAGINAEASIEIVADTVKPAVEGTHYTYYTTCGSDTLSFDKSHTSQYIVIKAIDNSEFGGDTKFSINLVSTANANKGASNVVNVTVADDEHPLAFILGTFTAKGVSYFNGDTEWNIAISKDESDLNTVWISNLVPDGTSLKVYGIVNEEKTEILIPVEQEIAASSSYPHIRLEGFVDAELNEGIATGGNITGTIAADGTITLNNAFGSCVYTDDACTSSAGWYNIMLPPATFTKIN